MSSNFNWPNHRAALITGHPGHELRVHHWVERAKPATLVLTDGSGRTRQSRLASTTRILERAGAVPGPVYGRFTDAAFYNLMIRQETGTFIPLLEEITNWLIAGEFDYVAGDALEGYNTSHEFCRYLTGAACELVKHRTGRVIRNFDFLLTGHPGECPEEMRDGAIQLSLDAEAVQRKLASANDYPEIKHEVEAALQQFGLEMFATEWLRPVANDAGLQPPPGIIPFYEVYGEKQKANGTYEHVIRQNEHMQPLMQALWNHVQQSAA